MENVTTPGSNAIDSIILQFQHDARNSDSYHDFKCLKPNMFHRSFVNANLFSVNARHKIFTSLCKPHTSDSQQLFDVVKFELKDILPLGIQPQKQSFHSDNFTNRIWNEEVFWLFGNLNKYLPKVQGLLYEWFAGG